MDDYTGRGNALELELRRIRGILDQHAQAKELGFASEDGPVIRKAYRDLLDVVEPFKALDREFWGDVIAEEDG